MKFDDFLRHFSPLSLIDLSTISNISGESRKKILAQLHQWVKRDFLIHLRRGLYTFSDRYRKIPLSPYRLANEMLRPSYLSSFSALAYYSLIPEMVVEYTSVTTRVTRRFQNHFGTFSYSSLRREFFWGYTLLEIDQNSIKIAEPEKALLDFFHLNKKKWTRARLQEMRFQNFEQLNWKKMARYAKRWGSPRLKQVTRDLKEMHERGTLS